MGNHEYCTGCGQSDFHRGQTCQQAYPKEYAREKKLKLAEAARLRTLAACAHSDTIRADMLKRAAQLEKEGP